MLGGGDAYCTSSQLEVPLGACTVGSAITPVFGPCHPDPATYIPGRAMRSRLPFSHYSIKPKWTREPVHID